MFIKVPHYATYEIKYFGLIYLGWQLLRFQYGNSPVLNRSANQETRLSLRTYILIKQWVFITFVNWIIYQLIEIFVNEWWIQNTLWVCLQFWLIVVQVWIKYNSIYGSIFRFITMNFFPLGYFSFYSIFSNRVSKYSSITNGKTQSAGCTTRHDTWKVPLLPKIKILFLFVLLVILYLLSIFASRGSFEKCLIWL